MCLNNKNNGGLIMAHGGVNSVLRKGASIVCKAKNTCVQEGHGGGKAAAAAGVGSRRIFAPLFKLQVLDSYRNDADCKGNQRATARKYGIHRRQIQKWLQVENTLRNSVAAKNNNNNNNNNSNINNNKVTLISNCSSNPNQKSGGNKDSSNVGRHSSTPLDFSTHCRASPSVASISSSISASRPISSHTNAPSASAPPHCLYDPSLPIDLSKKSAVGASHFNNNSNSSSSSADTTTTTPATTYLTSAPPVLEDHVAPLQPHHRLAYTPTGLTQAAPAHHSQYASGGASPSSLAADNSALGQRFDAADICWDLTTTKNKRKLDDNNNNNNNNHQNPDSGAKKIKLFKPYLNDNESDAVEDKPATIVSSTYIPLSLPPPIPIVNPNNSPSPISTVSSSSTSPQQPILCNCSDANCYYGNETDYTYTITELHPSGSKSYYYNNYLYHPHYNNNNNNQPITDCYYEDYQPNGSSLVKQQRQSYSLDFKLSAIDCYYQDSVCKGNQRAVANKYNVHRRQVQKWLKQAEELRLRNESLKQIHTVVR